MVDGITSYRDYYANAGSAAAGTGESGKVINAVYESGDKNAVSVTDFLSLMVAQLRNQDFLNPVDDTQYVTQLAQFATMQQMTDMASHMKNNYALSLVGKTVTAAKFTVSGELKKVTGTVDKISLVDNEYVITVGGENFSLQQIMEINHAGSGGGTGTGTGEGAGDKMTMLAKQAESLGKSLEELIEIYNDPFFTAHRDISGEI